MIVRLYSVQDLKVGFGAPYSAPNDAVAVRSFTAAVNDPQTTLHDFPQDYRLWYIADLDTDTGAVHPVVGVMIADGKEVYRGE